MKTQCPHCKAKINAPSEYKGKKVKCPKCKESFVCVESAETTIPAKLSNRPKEVAEKCENCGRTIGKLEHSYNYEGHTVCKDCKQRLEDLSSAAPKVKEKTVRTPWRTHPVAWTVLILFVLFLIGVFVGDSDDEDSSESSRRVARTQPVERPKPTTPKPKTAEQIAEEKRITVEQKRIQEEEHQRKEAKLKRDLDSFVTTLKTAGIDNSIIDRCSANDNQLTIVVTNAWHFQPYQIRLQAAQNLWNLWAKLRSPNDPDKARIELTDYNGNSVGGSRWLAGSLIWVKKE